MGQVVSDNQKGRGLSPAFLLACQHYNGNGVGSTPGSGVVVGSGVTVAVGSGVSPGTAASVAVGDGVAVGVGVLVPVGVGDGVAVGVGVDIQTIFETVIASPSHALLVEPLISAERPSRGSKSMDRVDGIIR